MTEFHYEVRVKIIKSKNDYGEIDYIGFKHPFEDENPIQARRKAFTDYQNCIDVLLESINLQYSTDEEARKYLKPFFKPTFRTIESTFDDTNNYGVGVFMIIDTPPTTNNFFYTSQEYLIHGIGNITPSCNDPNRIMAHLEAELECYEHLEKELKYYEYSNDIIEVVFCNSAEWQEGYLGNGKWKSSYEEPSTCQILKTPFDWNNYAKPYWWGESEEDYKPESISIEDIIGGGENNLVEFKPSLLYNFSSGKPGIGIKQIIAKAICAFLNSNGGYLFIGVTDKGEPQGLSYDFKLSPEGKSEEDFFRLEFDQMIEHFLTFSVKDRIFGDFRLFKDEIIFVIKVMPSKQRPIFLNAQNGKEFYVRGEASSRQITDMEELANYCISRWGRD
ncbi:hypothetical protein AGMMS49574_02770 [Bacteroidia bacterium]|nr:hypothetical protein AGMMS49574_02770 [Bacteroidia bacterium]